MFCNQNILFCLFAISHGNGFWWDLGYIYSKEAYACVFTDAAWKSTSEKCVAGLASALPDWMDDFTPKSSQKPPTILVVKIM